MLWDNVIAWRTDGVMWGGWGGLRHTWATSAGAAGQDSDEHWGWEAEKAGLVDLLAKNKMVNERQTSCMTFNLNQEVADFKPHLPIVMGKNEVFLALLCSSAVMAASKDRHIRCPWEKHQNTGLNLD